MDNFPKFMKSPADRVDPKSQYTPGIEGYVFDGVGGNQMAFWTYGEKAVSKKHPHEYDEYIAVLQGRYDVIIDGEVVPLKPGDEFVIPKGTLHSGEALAGTRAIYAFGGTRAKRET